MWLAKLLGFDYEIRYRKGKDNLATDALSDIPGHDLKLMALTTISIDLLEQIQQSWSTDSQLQEIIYALQNGSTGYPKFTWNQGQLCRKGQLVVGNNLDFRDQLLRMFHDSPQGGHFGVQATYKRLASLVY